MDYTNKSVSELKTLLKERQLPSTGKKEILIQRLQENDQESEKFKVIIKTLMGSCYDIPCDPDDTISLLKDKFQERTGIQPRRQVLYRPRHEWETDFDMTMGDVRWKMTTDGKLSDYNIVKGTVFYLFIKL